MSVSTRDWAELASNGRTIILVLDGNPPWAATYGGGPIDLVDISELVEFMTAAVRTLQCTTL